MRNSRFALAGVLAALLAVGAGAASAADFNWAGADLVDGNAWGDADNWTPLPSDDSNVPGISGNTDKSVDFNTADGDIVDVDAAYDVGAVRILRRMSFVDAGGSLSMDSLFFDNRGGNSTFNIPVSVDGQITSDWKTFAGCTFNSSLTLGAAATFVHLDKTWTFNGALVVNNPAGLVMDFKSQGTGGSNLRFLVNDTLTTGSVTIPASSILELGNTGKTDTLAGVAGPTTVGSTGLLNFVLAQTNFGGVVVLDGGTLMGATGTATWGDGNDIDIPVGSEAVLVISSGSEPTPDDLGQASSTMDARAWIGISGNGTYVAGDDGNSLWKGFAFEKTYTPNAMNKTLISPAGAGDVEIKWMSTAHGNKPQLKMDIISTDETGVANFYITGTLKSSWNGDGGTFTSGLNISNSDANACTTFNMNMLAGSSTTDLVTLGNDFRCKDDQTYNLIGQGRADVNPEDWHGGLTATGKVMIDIIGTQRQFLGVGTDPNVKITLNTNAAMRIPNNQINVLKLLSPSQLVVNDTPLIAIQRDSDITDANQPVLADLMTKSNIAVQGGDNANTNTKHDYVVGVDKWLMTGSGRTDRPVNFTAGIAGAKITTTAGPGESFGIAGLSGGATDIEMPVDANGATLLINSKAAGDGFRDYNNAVRTPDGQVGLGAEIRNAAEVRLGKGKIILLNDTIDNGTLVGGILPVVVEDEARLEIKSGGVTLTNTQVTIEQGGQVFADHNLTVRNLILNSTYAGGNDGDGLQIDDATDIVTVTGTLSGDGAWGDSGKIVVDSTGTVAPGNTVGTLSGTNLELADGAAYEWEIADPDANAGIGWDVIWGSHIDFDANDADDANAEEDISSLTFRIVDAGLARDITADEQFVVAAGGGFDVPAAWTVTFEAPVGWNASAAQLVDGGSVDVDGDESDERVYYLTGLLATRMLGTLTWDAGADGVWGEDVVGNWAPSGFLSPGSEPNYPDHPLVAAAVDTPWTVTVLDPNREAYRLAVSAGTVAVDAGGGLTVTTDTVIDGGTLDVAGRFATDVLTSSGTLTVAAGADVDANTLLVTDGAVSLSEDIRVGDLEITGGAVDTGDKAIVLSGTLQAPGVVVTSNAESFQAIGSGQPGEITVGMTENGKTTTVTPSAGPGETLNAPDLSFRSSPPEEGTAVLYFDAGDVLVGDLTVVDDASVQLTASGPAAPVSFRNLGGLGAVQCDAVVLSVRGAVRPGQGIGKLQVIGALAFEDGAAFQPEVQGADVSDVLYVETELDLTAGNDAIGPSWLPGSDASSMFGGEYVVANTGGIDGQFAVLGGGNIGAAYIADVAYDVDLGTGLGIAVTLHAQLAGDVDLDGQVARGDLLALRGGLGSTDADWLGGDLTFDGDVNYLDYIALKRSMGDSVPGGVGITPEPATLFVMMAAGLPALLKRRRA